jgi:DNA invertase Pin-like site-specific DNA recombinase
LKAVRVIPAKKNHTLESQDNNSKKRVAAYARVSTDFDEQQTSFDAQLDYYSKYIKSKPEWEFVKVYTDEGISGTDIKKRNGFNQMTRDAMEGRIDLILTKSVSRFARNTVDTLTVVRRLKEKNVEVYFEKENIYTMDSKGELLITIMSSIAQEESRQISENVTWGQRKRFSDGKVSLPYGQFLGYEKGEDGLPKVVEKEAKIIRRIYRLFLEGMTQSKIARMLTEEKILSPGGKTKWHSTTVKSILQNEKYKGDALLQKGYTLNFLTKKRKINEGEVPQYYVENSHEAIIEPETFELVQAEFKRRKKAGRYTSAINCFASRITCGDCGGFYGRKVWHSNTKYAQTIWQCNNKFLRKGKCTTPHLKEEVIKKAFVDAFNTLIDNKEKILSNYDEIIKKITDSSKEEGEIEKIEIESQGLQTSIERLISENARTTIDQAEYAKKYNSLVEKHNNLQRTMQTLLRDIDKKKAKRNLMKAFLKTLKEQKGLLTEFDEKIWSATLNYVTVKNKKELVFNFKDGRELPWSIEDER